jgi:hypothetical protein
MLAIDRIGVPPALITALKHLESLHNPEFYEKEKQRFSTWNTRGSSGATARPSTCSCSPAASPRTVPRV